MDTSQNQRQIVRRLHALECALATEIDTRFAEEGVDRRDLMLLTALDSPDDASRPPHRGPGRTRRLRHLAARGWIDDTGTGTWALTDDGRAARLRLEEIRDTVRRRAVDAVGQDAFDTTMRNLDAMTRALGGDPDAPPRGGRRRFGRHGFGHPGAGRAERGDGDNRHHGFGPHDPRCTPAT
ncbi:helix-turn-helix domain-containing protein [Microbacterium xanthum]|uniref:helix-turn-helix domain-containing protein n=1 Tax=Microbacterium xanthum TaxID=3079794 RepID=UPI002AD3D4D4|nr:hypothetical protein [Microbacterium sp. KSW-48]MDZ8172998.1 hypothetical protein [Microbacterium sp. KSW-48]